MPNQSSCNEMLIKEDRIGQYSKKSGCSTQAVDKTEGRLRGQMAPPGVDSCGIHFKFIPLCLRFRSSSVALFDTYISAIIISIYTPAKLF